MYGKRRKGKEEKEEERSVTNCFNGVAKASAEAWKKFGVEPKFALRAWGGDAGSIDRRAWGLGGFYSMYRGIQHY